MCRFRFSVWCFVGLMIFILLLLLVPLIRAQVIGTVFNFAWFGYERHLLPGDIRSLSLPVHGVGMHFIKSGMVLEEAVNICTRHFRGGCIHGVVMEHVLGLQDRTPVTLFELCRSLVDEATSDDFHYFQCVHAVGHVFMMESESPITAVTKCSIFLSAYQSACASGVFMQYAVVDPMVSHAHHRKGSHTVAPLPCDMVADPLFRKACFISEGFYRHYFPNMNDFDRSYVYCAEFGGDEASWCKQGVDLMREEIINP
jgi:hypothetical protein